MTPDISHELKLLGYLREFQPTNLRERKLIDEMRLVVCRALEEKLSLNSREKA